MLSRTVCFIAVLVGSVAFALLVTTVEAAHAIESEKQNILSECKQTDYRSYIQCLRRLKRHNRFPHSDSDCPEECYNKCSTELKCESKCSHCVKITKRKHTYEEEIECVAPECKTKENVVQPGSTNISTRIDIHNTFNANITCCPTCNPPTPCPSQPVTQPPPIVQPPPVTQPPPIYPPPVTQPPILPTPPPPDIIVLPPRPPPIIMPPPTTCCPTCNPPITYCPPYYQGGWGGWNSNFRSGGWGGCPYQNTWLCASFYGGYNTMSHQNDCSGCGLPYQYYRCDANCYMTQNIGHGGYSG